MNHLVKDITDLTVYQRIELIKSLANQNKLPSEGEPEVNKTYTVNALTLNPEGQTEHNFRGYFIRYYGEDRTLVVQRTCQGAFFVTYVEGDVGKLMQTRAVQSAVLCDPWFPEDFSPAPLIKLTVEQLCEDTHYGIELSVRPSYTMAMNVSDDFVNINGVMYPSFNYYTKGEFDFPYMAPLRTVSIQELAADLIEYYGSMNGYEVDPDRLALLVNSYCERLIEVCIFGQTKYFPAWDEEAGDVFNNELLVSSFLPGRNDGITTYRQMHSFSEFSTLDEYIESNLPSGFGLTESRYREMWFRNDMGLIPYNLRTEADKVVYLYYLACNSYWGPHDNQMSSEELVETSRILIGSLTGIERISKGELIPGWREYVQDKQNPISRVKGTAELIVDKNVRKAGGRLLNYKLDLKQRDEVVELLNGTHVESPESYLSSARSIFGTSVIKFAKAVSGDFKEYSGPINFGTDGLLSPDVGRVISQLACIIKNSKERIRGLDL